MCFTCHDVRLSHQQSILHYLTLHYLLSNICTKNYWNRTTTVEIVVGGWVVSFFERQCT